MVNGKVGMVGISGYARSNGAPRAGTPGAEKHLSL